MPEPPPRQHEHERRCTPFTHPFILTRRMWKVDYDGQMIFGDLVDLKLPDICLTGEEKPQTKTSPRTRARCEHLTACSTSVDSNLIRIIKNFRKILRKLLPQESCSVNTNLDAREENTVSGVEFLILVLLWLLFKRLPILKKIVDPSLIQSGTF